jgi:2-haloacid dehalogenase
VTIETIRALAFDVFGTVVDWRSGVARDAAFFLAALGRDDIDPFAVADAWRALYSPSMEEVRSGRRPFIRLDALHRESLEAILPRFGIDADRVDPNLVAELNLAWHRLDPWPDALAGLRRLKRRYILATLSNGNIALLVNMAKRAELPWDAVLGAEVSQAYKPEPEAYLRTADALGLRPVQVCMVAAHESDLAAARGCGFRTAFVPRPLEYGPARAAVAPGGDWDLVVRDFVALADRLGA